MVLDQYLADMEFACVWIVESNLNVLILTKARLFVAYSDEIVPLSGGNGAIYNHLFMIAAVVAIYLKFHWNILL